jgi:hypothetical protein
MHCEKKLPHRTTVAMEEAVARREVSAFSAIFCTGERWAGIQLNRRAATLQQSQMQIDRPVMAGMETVTVLDRTGRFPSQPPRKKVG